jgi:hypothetical protein
MIFIPYTIGAYACHRHLGFYRGERRAIRDDPHTSILFSSQSVIVTSSKLLAERINDLAMKYGASASHVYELGSVERIAGYDAERISDTPRITLDNFSLSMIRTG